MIKQAHHCKTNGCWSGRVMYVDYCSWCIAAASPWSSIRTGERQQQNKRRQKSKAKRRKRGQS